MKRSLFAELKRRNVFKAGVAYLALGWVVTQVTSTVGPAMNLPSWIVPVVIWIGVIGFPFLVAFSWIYEITPEGLKREDEVDRSASITHITGRRMDYLIVGLLVLAIGFSAFDRFGPRRSESTTSRETTAPAAVSAATPASPSDPAPTTAQPAASDNSIAVLPFVDMSSAKDQEYFSDGITAQLINAATDKHLWSETYDRKLDDVFQVQDEIAGKVVEELRVTLLGGAPKVRTTDPKAYALYLEAVQLGRLGSVEGYAKSDELYRQVLAIDSRYAPAWTGTAKNAFNETAIGVLSNKEGFTRGRDAVSKALEIDPDYDKAHAQLGWIAMTADNDLAGAAKHFDRALALDPSNVDVLSNAAVLLFYIGHLDQALAIEVALSRRDPLNVTRLFNTGFHQRLAGRYDDAVASLRAALSLSPNRGNAHSQAGFALMLKGDAVAALAEMEQETSEAYRLIGLVAAYHALGRKADSDRVLAALIGKYEKDAPYNIAFDYAFRGEADKAFEWLDKTIEYQDPGLSEIVVENLFTKIHSDPRWLPFLRKVGKAPEQLAKIEFKVTLPKEWLAETTVATDAKPPVSTR